MFWPLLLFNLAIIFSSLAVAPFFWRRETSTLFALLVFEKFYFFRVRRLLSLAVLISDAGHYYANRLRLIHAVEKVFCFFSINIPHKTFP